MTPSGRTQGFSRAAPRTPPVSSSQPGRVSGPETNSPVSSGRYTPPKATYRLRPRWHRRGGWAGVALGIAIAVANDAMVFTDHVTLLPFGHQELYLMLALVVASSSTWFLGLFDRGPTIYE